jgi:hypothetical protein
MPVNRPTNTHGQGYSDLNFIMAELANGLDYLSDDDRIVGGAYYGRVDGPFTIPTTSKSSQEFCATATARTRTVTAQP